MILKFNSFLERFFNAECGYDVRKKKLIEFGALNLRKKWSMGNPVLKFNKPQKHYYTLKFLINALRIKCHVKKFQKLNVLEKKYYSETNYEGNFMTTYLDICVIRSIFLLVK